MKITNSELKEILNLHKKWFLTDGAKGKQANLWKADLRKANLREADLEMTSIYTFSLGKHFAFYHQSTAYDGGDYLRIGCLGHSLSDWLKDCEKIGQKNDYRKSDIVLYRKMMMFINDNIKKV